MSIHILCDKAVDDDEYKKDDSDNSNTDGDTDQMINQSNTGADSWWRILESIQGLECGVCYLPNDDNHPRPLFTINGNPENQRGRLQKSGIDIRNNSNDD